MSLAKFTQRLVVAGLFAALLAAGSVTARADSITYDVMGTYSNGLTLSGQYVWDDSIAGATSYLLNLDSTTGPATCSDPSGALCTASFALFEGTGSLNTSIVFVLSLLDPSNPIFTLVLEDTDTQEVLFSDTIMPTPTAQVPEPSTLGFVFVALSMLGYLVTRRRGVRGALAVR
jgi:PEP-CTERM motif